MESLFDDLERRTVVAESLVKYMQDKMSEIESRHWNSDLVRGSGTKRLRDLEKREKEFESFQEGKRRELELKEVELRSKREEFVKEVELREEELDEHREWLEVAQIEVQSIRKRACKKLQEIESQAQELKTANGLLDAKEKELVLKEEQFDEKVKLIDDKFSERDRLGCGFIEGLELTENKLHRMRLMMDKRFKEIEFRESEFVAASAKEADLIRENMEIILKELEEMERQCNSFQEETRQELVLKEQQLNMMSEQLEMKKAEMDSKAKELDKRKKGIKRKEDDIYSKEKEFRKKRKVLQFRKMNLRAWEKKLDVKQREVDSAQEFNEQRMAKLDCRENNLNSVRKFTRSCFEEHLASKKKLQIDRDLVEKHARDVEIKEQQLEHRARELELMEIQVGDRVKELELKQQQFTEVFNAPVKIVPDESVDLKFVVTMNGKTLQMFLNDHEEDLELMGDEIFKVLHLSTDPAKLVLDAMEGFYPPHLRRGDTELKVMRTCILLLEQLIKMSPKIKPGVREAAIELASEWKSKMRITAENPTGLLGFLLLLAAYSISLCFDRDELQRFLTLVAQQRQTPELCRILGFTKSNAGLEKSKIVRLCCALQDEY
ncbi:hypothetical protein ACJIZ3_011850 [Penstemon smallii]|uniref:FRIGIDA-like protein n=1 Tax=Penstemon smallii TaxID=265156 RepID=A0ABD3UN60_9LAMI